MSLAWIRRAVGTAGWLALAGAAVAAESLPPLRVDPVLLGGAALKPAPAPAPQPSRPAEAPPPAEDRSVSPEQPAETPARKRPVERQAETPAAASATVKSDTREAALPAVPPSAAEVSPVAPPPPARPLPAPATKPLAAPAVPQPAVPTPIPALAPPPAAKPVPMPLAAPQPRVAPPLAAAQAAAAGARNLPPLRVDPALLGGAPAQLATQTQPPQVAERAEVAPLYSAHVQAGLLPAPAMPGEPVDKKNAPTYVTARNISGVNEVEVVAEGAAELQRATDILRAERIVFNQEKDEVQAVGDVQLISPDSVISGPRLRLQMTDSVGEFEAPAYALRHQPQPVVVPALTMTGMPIVSKGGKILAASEIKVERPAVTGSGTAALLEFLGEDKYRLRDATYSTCAPGQRDWEIVVDKLDLDYVEEVGEARGATVRFKDVPLFYTPWLDFPLSAQRKSGFLAPTIGSTSKSGMEISAPWYWNIAPDMDATIAPRLMTKRGMQLNTEFRYLDPAYHGQLRAEYLPDDRLAGTSRYGYALKHTQNLGGGFSALLNVNGVSDDDYFTDLSTRMAQISQGNLLRQALLAYNGPWYGATLNVQSFQTLLDLATPYRRMPQLTATASRHDLPLGLSFDLSAEHVDFDHPTLVLGKRTTFYPRIALPLTYSAFWLTPKLGFHSTSYELERQGALDPEQKRALPIFSVDGGFTMERPVEWSGRSYLQTLEPRAYYLYVPKRKQQDIPVFDTALTDFNYAQLFAENRYAGGDRIGDANHLTLALTSRLIDPATGADLIRAAIGQRYYFSDQYVTLPGERARTTRTADLLAAVSGQVLPKTYADFGWQYNPEQNRSERLTVGMRYMPLTGKILNTAYRFTREQIGQIDISGQWPLFGGWNAVGRYNYSTKESRLVEGIAGLEYNGGCWIARLVVQRLAVRADSPSSSIFVQLELNDISRIGSNPLDLLRRSIPGYGVINQPTADPVFAAQ
jgi:LPS-assembly protein